MAASPAPASSAASSAILEEWKEARASLKAFDDKIHELRKYGFTFITALLTAQSIIVPSITSGSAASAAVTDGVKFGVISVTQLLVVAVRIMEYNCRFFQEAVKTRVHVIEIYLNLELTSTISDRYNWKHMDHWVTALYGFFALGVLLVGLLALPLEPYLIPLLFVFAVAIAAILLLHGIQLNFKHNPEDWTIDQTQCLKGEDLKITLTNLDEIKPIRIPRGSIAFVIRKEGDSMEDNTVSDPPKDYYQQKVDSDIFIGAQDNYTWQWKAGQRQDPTKALEAGMFRVVPSTWNEEQEKRLLWQFQARRDSSNVTVLQPLRRKIIVT